MRQLIATAAGLAVIFASTFIVIKATGVLTIDDIKAFLTAAHEIAPLYGAVIVILLLTSDLFIAVPTLTVTVLSGYFLGFPVGFLASTTGLLGAGITGYVITYVYGPGLLNRIHKDAEKRAEMESLFARYGGIVLVICRALPILPEVSCCLAGATRMRFPTFILSFLLGTIPYALIATYAGSRSTIEDPKPAIIAAIGLSAFFATAWILLRNRYNAERKRR
ncbi:MAG: VTT domain-containing protein [Rhodospirillales bacterium]|nr:VTT domain-containing protein [Rhodospirillales bacterium]